MTPRDVLDLAVALEKDLADFYQDIAGIDRLRPFADIFSFMVDHSARHARQIERSAVASEWPRLNTEPIDELHRRLKSSLLEQIRNEEDEEAVLAMLARTEDILGQLYQSVAAHYRKRSQAAAAVADLFERLAREEQEHRDFILGK